MTSILERIDDWIRGSLHRFVDRALESSSLMLYDQDVRDMEQAIDHLEEATSTMYAAARANERRLEKHQEDAASLDLRLERLTAAGVSPTSERVMVAQAELEAKRDLILATQAQVERQQAQFVTLKKRLAETQLVAQTLEDARPRMESLLVLSRAYRSVEQVELTLEALRGLGGDTKVAIVADSIYQRFNEAQARLDAIDRVDDLDLLIELEQAEVEDQLAERRRRLGLEPEEEIKNIIITKEEEVSPVTPPAESPEIEPSALKPTHEKPEPQSSEPLATDEADGLPSTPPAEPVP